ncbi:MAG: hypothetical protein AAF612_05340 [Planctomycetota bacterium]
MIKTLGLSLLLVVAVNVLGTLGFVGWLAGTDRLSEARVQQAIDLFTPTIAQDEAARAEAEQLAAQAEAHAAELTRLASVDRGLVTLAQRFDAERLTDATARAMLERTQTAVSVLQQRLDTDRALLQDQRRALDEREAAFEQRVAQQADALADADFKRAVKTLSSLPPGQGADALRALIDAGDQDQAVAYLAAMSVGQSANVLREFNGPADAALVAALLEDLRVRSQTLDPAAVNPAGANG